MFEAIVPGLVGERETKVEIGSTAGHLGSDSVAVFSTPEMVRWMERAAVAAVDHLLPAGYRTVGAHLDVRHLAPTPIGFEVRAVAQLLEVDGRRLTFRVEVYEVPFDDDGGGGMLVGEGTHERAIIDVQRFGQRIAAKLTAASDSA